ncbi:hypothetical protein DOTSEDRAFT_36575 [Dothistroma septosporum NZE10]|uniref:Uncharacterized protein n=1 Tax=Dothistroma septosporum (strain NZE10 / CBS 128990) TaxID=675120 RepID=N1PMU0_DOTSN|nr:hypothetical protein DOTSEDRAFT_36575 [Dothistroma septosporum NZE10]
MANTFGTDTASQKDNQHMYDDDTSGSDGETEGYIPFSDERLEQEFKAALSGGDESLSDDETSSATADPVDTAAVIPTPVPAITLAIPSTPMASSSHSIRSACDCRIETAAEGERCTHSFYDHSPRWERDRQEEKPWNGVLEAEKTVFRPGLFKAEYPQGTILGWHKTDEEAMRVVQEVMMREAQETQGAKDRGTLQG